MKMLLKNLLITTVLLYGCAAITPSQPPAPPTSQSYAPLVESLNRAYNDVQQNDCREIGTNLPRGHYYCTGIIIRATEDGDYLPWTNSPMAMERGSVSFSWFRKDDHPDYPFKGVGFILRNPVEGERLGLPGFDDGFICLFPVDALTGNNRLHGGCVSRFGKPAIHAFNPQPDIPHHNIRFAWGSCEDIGITTLEQWIDYVGDMQGGARGTQCSWNVDSQNGWRNSLAMHAHYPYLDEVWNELLMATVDDGYSRKDYISAVYVDAANYAPSIEAARTFQRKLIANNSYAPIIRLDLASDQPFSFHQEDQIIVKR